MPLCENCHNPCSEFDLCLTRERPRQLLCPACFAAYVDAQLAIATHNRRRHPAPSI